MRTNTMIGSGKFEPFSVWNDVKLRYRIIATQWTSWVLNMCFEKFPLAVESHDLTQADKSIIRVSSLPFY